MAKILFIGDVVGKPGRRALKGVLPQWQEKYQPDVIIVNVENLAHGKGTTLATFAEIDQLHIDVYTGGNHIFKKNDPTADCFDKYPNLIRPANFESLKINSAFKAFSNQGEYGGQIVPGYGFYRFVKNGQQYLTINLNGQVFMEKQFDGEIGNPFRKIDYILTQESQKGDIIIVDFHAEATSEKVAMGLYLDGRVTAVVGTHTHVPTSDARILPHGTAYITDVGMTGTRDSVLGVKFQNALEKFLDPEAKFRGEVEEAGVMQVNGVLVEAGGDGRAIKIEKLYAEF